MTVTNNADYYEDVARKKYRPLWTKSDVGYMPPDLVLFVDPKSVVDGLRITVDGVLGVKGLTYNGFKKGSKEVMVAVSRGPLEYAYPAPRLWFGQACALMKGERGRVASRTEEWSDVALNMPGKPGETAHPSSCTRMTTCYACRVEMGPHFVPGLPHVVAHPCRRDGNTLPPTMRGSGVVWWHTTRQHLRGELSDTTIFCSLCRA